MDWHLEKEEILRDYKGLEEKVRVGSPSTFLAPLANLSVDPAIMGRLGVREAPKDLKILW